MLLIVDLILFISLSGRGWFSSPSFSEYKNNIVIKEGGTHSCWISDSASIKETCILWVPGYVNTGWRGKHLLDLLDWRLGMGFTFLYHNIILVSRNGGESNQPLPDRLIKRIKSTINKRTTF
jgi:hypothetical protein